MVGMVMGIVPRTLRSAMMPAEALPRHGGRVVHNPHPGVARVRVMAWLRLRIRIRAKF